MCQIMQTWKSGIKQKKQTISALEIMTGTFIVKDHSSPYSCMKYAHHLVKQIEIVKGIPKSKQTDFGLHY